MCRWATHFQVLGPGFRVLPAPPRKRALRCASPGVWEHTCMMSPKVTDGPKHHRYQEPTDTPDITDTPDTPYTSRTLDTTTLGTWNLLLHTQDTQDRHWNPFTDSFSLLTSRRADGAATSFAWRYELAGAPCLPHDFSDTQNFRFSTKTRSTPLLTCPH